MEKSNSMPSIASPSSPTSPSSRRPMTGTRTPGGADLEKAAKHIQGLFSAGVPPASWNIRDVGSWVEMIGLPQYRKMMVSHGVDGGVLLKMSPDTLEYLGVRSLGHRERLMADIAKLKEMAFNPEEAGGDGGAERQKVIALVKRQQSLADQTAAVRELKTELNDLAKRGVFARLQKSVDTIGIEGGAELVKQAYENICQLKAQVFKAEQDLFEKKKALGEDQAKAARLMGLADVEVLKSLSSTVSMPPLSAARTLDPEGLDNLTKRLHPDPELEKEKKQKAMEAMNETLKSRRLLSGEELSAQFERLYPDPSAERAKWAKRDMDQDMEVKRMVARGTFDMEPDTRKQLIEGFNDRWRADMVKRGLI